MPLYYDDDQAMLAETAQQFMSEEGAIAKQLRHWRDRDCKDGFGHGLWKQFAEMGFTGMLEYRAQSSPVAFPVLFCARSDRAKARQ